MVAIFNIYYNGPGMVSSGYISTCAIVMHLNVRPASCCTFVFNICVRLRLICNGKRYVGSGWLSCRTNPSTWIITIWCVYCPISSATIIVNVPLRCNPSYTSGCDPSSSFCSAIFKLMCCARAIFSWNSKYINDISYCGILITAI